MSIGLSLNLLNTQLPALRGPIEDGLRTKSDFIDWFRKVATKSPDANERQWKPLETARVFTANPIKTGNEMLAYATMPTATTQKKVGGDTGKSIGRIIWTCAIPNRDIISVKDMDSAKAFYKQLPKRGLFDGPKDLEKFILTGKSAGLISTTSDLTQMMSFGPAYNSGVYSGLENGFFDALAPASQTKSVLGLAKSTAYGHYNQYALVRSASAEYLRQLIDQYRQCGRQYVEETRAPKVWWTDTKTHANYAEARAGRIVVSTVTDDTKRAEMELPIDGTPAKVRYTYAVDPAVDFAGNPCSDGWTLGLDPTDLEETMVEDFTVGDWAPIPNTDQSGLMITLHCRYVLWSLRTSSLIAGGNTM